MFTMQKEIQEFLQFKSSHIKQTSLDCYFMWLNRFHKFTQKELGEVSEQDITKFKNILELKYSGKSIEHAFNIIHSYFKFWSGERKCLNPGRIHVPHSRSNSHPTITHEDYYKLVRCLDDNHFPDLQRKVWLSLLYETGTRINELLSIDVDDVDVVNRRATILTEKTYKSRAIYWGDETNNLLNRYLAIRLEIKRSKALFIGLYNTGEYSERLTARSLERSLKTICLRAGVTQKIVPHSFRHARIQEWLNKGLSLIEISLLSGHQSINSLEHYTRLSNEKNEINARKAL